MATFCTLVTISCFVFSAKSSSNEMPNNAIELNLLGPGVVNSEPIAPIQIKTEVISPTEPAMKAEVISPTKLVIKTEVTSPTKLTIKTEVISPTNPADIETFPSPPQPDQSFNSSTTGKILGSEISPSGSLAPNILASPKRIFLIANTGCMSPPSMIWSATQNALISEQNNHSQVPATSQIFGAKSQKATTK